MVTLSYSLHWLDTFPPFHLFSILALTRYPSGMGKGALGLWEPHKVDSKNN